MRTKRFITRVLLATVTLTLCGIPELAQAQSASTSEQQRPAETQPASTETKAPAGTQQNNGIVDPSKGPLTPVPSNTEEAPNAPSAERQQSSTPAVSEQAAPQQPVGTAAAQAGPAAGGPASKPAGNAIAPAKQRQVRSLLIKLGAVAAAGIAIGTVAALSRGSSSKPPGAK